MFHLTGRHDMFFEQDKFLRRACTIAVDLQATAPRCMLPMAHVCVSVYLGACVIMFLWSCLLRRGGLSAGGDMVIRNRAEGLSKQVWAKAVKTVCISLAVYACHAGVGHRHSVVLMQACCGWSHRCQKRQCSSLLRCLCADANNLGLMSNIGGHCCAGADASNMV